MLRIYLMLCCSTFLLFGCNEEDCINSSYKVSHPEITTRYVPVEWGRVRCELIGRTLTVEWNCPTGNEEVGMLFSLYSSNFGLITSFETFYYQTSGSYSMELPDRYNFSNNETFYLVVLDSFSSPVRVDLFPTEGGYFGESEPKCNHNFSENSRYRLLNLKANLYGSYITGTIEALITKPCRFIMKYTYQDIIRGESYTGYLCEDFTSPVSYYDTIKLYWNDAAKILSHNATSIRCEVRLYDLACGKFIPNPECGFVHDDIGCQNYLRVAFTTDIINGAFDFPDWWEEIK